MFEHLRELKREDWIRPSVIALIIANVVPVFGVVFLDWEVFPLMLLFWFENVIIGLFNVLRMAMAQSGLLHWSVKLFLIPFFFVHYGMFTFVHGIFVFALFGGGEHRISGAPSVRLFVEAIREYHLGWAVLGLAVSHGVSFVSNYIRRGEYCRAEPNRLMVQPYARIFILHITILAGGFIMALLKAPVAGLIVLILLKTVVDLGSHVAERKKFAGADLSATPHAH